MVISSSSKLKPFSEFLRCLKAKVFTVLEYILKDENQRQIAILHPNIFMSLFKNSDIIFFAIILYKTQLSIYGFIIGVENFDYLLQFYWLSVNMRRLLLVF